ncbi:M56 family metallopeptidase [Muriicola sp. Z0-33]|uniref:M56 family metallopeptidase n=1 Tax=Muriicola sp. Z0-33 TaxID=2816957 RepID=UPI0022384DC1|nr:M56 family metallopeptidase [Muriicola sp. Z0-33]MCW5517228.1 M56 family metallopeptidase [Muriicola sp. Z0-33]
MLLYILKFTFCLAALLIFYKLFLERESIHVFKRFYLLGALFFSLTVPSLVFTEYVVVEAGTETILQPVVTSSEVINVPPALEADAADIAPILWVVYLLGVIFFGLKFIKNLFQILKRIRNNPKIDKLPFIQVLLLQHLPPHTFFNYIFLNKERLEANEIPKEVLLHEETHAMQKHSLDVLFIEILQIIMWFNPLIYIIKKSIKLNHEFLADKAVLKKGIDSSTYQNTLLSFMTPIHQQSLANAINYSSIKKRFTVMTSQTSRRSILLKNLLLLPLIGLLLISFSNKEIHYETAEGISEESELNISQLKIEIKDDLSLWLNDQQVELDKLTGQMLQIVPPKSLSNSIFINASPDIEIPDWLINQLHIELGKLGIKTIEINTRLPKINHYDDDKKPVFARHEKIQGGATEEQLKIFKKLAKKYNAIPMEERKIPMDDLRTLESIYKIMLPLQKAHAEAFPAIMRHKANSQEGASRKLMAEYNKLAKHYNNMPRRNMKISLKDVERLRHIYSLMSDKQKADAEPFPDFPPMPDPPGAATAPQLANVPEVAPSAKVAPGPAIASQAVRAVKAAQATLPPSPPSPETPVLAAAVNVPPPPPPPAPDPLEHVIQLAKEDAIFYYRGKKIDAEKAISIVKENKELSISVKRKNNESPVVKISKYL